MKKTILALIAGGALAMVPVSPSQTQTPSLAGTWQATLHAGPGLRLVMRVSPDGHNGFKAEIISIDQTPTPMPVSSLTLNGAAVQFAIDSFHVKYEGTLSADGQTLKGTFTQGASMPLDFERATPATEWAIDPSPHKAQFVTVDKNVKLEVLDWGGNGRPLVLLAGLGGTAHVFDKIAPKLIANFHVVGITRRGFGTSTAPEPIEANYSVQRLGDDVLDVIHQLKLEKPILAGHSIAGEELSYIGTEHPEQVAGLVYLDAGYPYAYYDPTRGDLSIDTDETTRALHKLASFATAAEQKKIIEQLLTVDLPALTKDLERQQKLLADIPDQPMPSGDSPEMRISAAVIGGETRFSTVKCPVLAIFASPHDLGPAAAGMDAAERAKMEAADADRTGAQVKAFQEGNPKAHVVVLAHASHGVFVSNEADVLREISSFAATLKP